MVAIETPRGVTTRVRFLPSILISLGSKSGTLFYLKRRNRVNTILTLGHEFAFNRSPREATVTSLERTPRKILVAALRLEPFTGPLTVYEKICVDGNARVWAKALAAALLMAPLWVLASVAAWELPML
jgi:hypothetical protein